MDKPTVVVFRKFKDDGGIIAIFPELPGDRNRYTCMSYMHIGQHGSCDPYGLVETTALAKEDEYEELAKELEKIGYNLDIRVRITAKMHEKRFAECAGRK